MSLISKFNFNYHYKVLTELLSNNKYEEFLLNLIDLSKKKKDTFVQLMNTFAPNFSNNIELQSNLKNKIIWINSFQIKDTDFITKFINEYFAKQKENILFPTDYPILLEKINRYLNVNEYSISYQEELHDLFQIMINLVNNEENIFIKNNGAFFETSNKKHFTYPYTCKAYIVYVRSPLKLYSELKNYYTERDLAMSHLFNLENNPESKIINNVKFEVNKQGWAINTNSWLNENVKNTYKGIVIKEEDLIKEPMETLLSIVIHLNSVGINAGLDYDTIEKFLLNNPIPNIPAQEFSISNKELKFIRKNVNPFLDDPDFQI